MTEIILPLQKVKATHQNPKNLIIFSKPKTGKTELSAQLENSFILDLEDGTDFVDAIKMKAKSVEEIKAIGEAIIKANKPYNFVVVDTITKLEQICLPYAELLYSRTPMGKNWFKKKEGVLSPDSGKAIYGTITSLPNGAGYQYTREAMMKMIDYIKSWAPHVILLAHVKDTLLEKEGAEVSAMELDLTGKVKRILSADSDAIGYLYRAKNNQNILSFRTNDDVACGARPAHLRNQEFVISELTEEGLKTYWEKVYIDK